MRYSRQRQTILDVIKSTVCHPTAEWVYEEVSKQVPNISLGTVYRNLGTLVESGEIIKVETSDKAIHYDGMVEDHPHFVCEVCGGVYDVQLPNMDTAMLIDQGYNVKSTKLVMYGVCCNCNTKH